MIIDDVFNVIGVGFVVTGRIQNEKVEVGQRVIIDGAYLPGFAAEIKAIEAFRKKVRTAVNNDYVGIVLCGVGKNQIKEKMKMYSF